MSKITPVEEAPLKLPTLRGGGAQLSRAMPEDACTLEGEPELGHRYSTLQRHPGRCGWAGRSADQVLHDNLERRGDVCDEESPTWPLLDSGGTIRV
jgi:hypothetical protein